MDDKVIVKHNLTGEEQEINVKEFLNDVVLSEIVQAIKQGIKTFNIPQINLIQDKLGLSIIHGANSNQKADIVLDVYDDKETFTNQGFGIKSYLGSKPTLLNASGANTNFIFEVENLNKKYVDEINSIDTQTKLKDRINKIFELGGSLKFYTIENSTMNYNLSLVDSIMPELLSYMLLEFFVNRTSSISQNISNVSILLSTEENNFDLQSFIVKIKRFLVAVLLGFFTGKKWDGKYVSNGTIVVKENGEQVAFHIVALSELEDYLFENIKFDTPSTTRHRYGSLIVENNGVIKKTGC